MFFPMAVILSVIFAVGNIALIPFAYLYALTHKIVIVSRNFSCRALLEVPIWLIFGVPFLVISVFVDLTAFFKLSYRRKALKVTRKNYDFSFNFSHESFKLLTHLVENHDSNNAMELVLKMQKSYKVLEVTRDLIRHTKESGISTYNYADNANIANLEKPEALHSLQMYKLYKAMVWNSVDWDTWNAEDTTTKTVDLDNMKTLLKEV